MLTVISKVTTKNNKNKKPQLKEHSIRKNQGIKMFVIKYLIQRAVTRKDKKDII